MKRSNKILLIFSLSILGIIGIANLALYVRYRQGIIQTEKNPASQQVFNDHGMAPTLLSLEGGLYIRIIPSDTFSVEWDRSSGAKIKILQSGDTVIIRGEGASKLNPHFDWQDYGSFPFVTVHGGSLRNIALSNVYTSMRGAPSPVSNTIAIRIANSQFVMGEPGIDQQYDFGVGGDSAYLAAHPEFYDSIVIDAVNSNLTINGNSLIHKFQLQLDDSSQLSDTRAQIDSPEIRYRDHSRILLSGANLRKLK